MGMGDVSNQVTPKPVSDLQAVRNGGRPAGVRYFMPDECQCHPVATTGAVGIATACISDGNRSPRRLISRTRTPPVDPQSWSIQAVTWT